MTMKLYYASGACSFVPHAMLEMAGATFEPVAVKLHKGEQYGDEYKTINPRSQVPVLADGDEVITQIMAIITYIDGKFPENAFIPKDPLARARFYEALAWMNNTVHPTFTHVFMPHKYSDHEPTQAEVKRFATASYRTLLGELQELLKKANAAGNDWLSGVRCGPLDAYALTLLRWGTIAGVNPEDFPELWAHVQRTAQMPAIARTMERERLQLNLYKPA
ncbi:glutathione S-transferase family protein [Ottowia sp.]|uniref:glutathione S-transferase family protein n=1 Tax=Ottowia sp. TaxID=1898956 RepID=UPI002B67B5B4|nr:glutathione S-transferase family protein [Ottowia sp.]HRN77007.1 glutathione S-transferase family protein [Ottowia sp.]HRQ03761.1 glutathione S-transferase family protein [Ottowia sp.]